MAAVSRRTTCTYIFHHNSAIVSNKLAFKRLLFVAALALGATADTCHAVSTESAPDATSMLQTGARSKSSEAGIAAELSNLQRHVARLKAEVEELKTHNRHLKDAVSAQSDRRVRLAQFADDGRADGILRKCVWGVAELPKTFVDFFLKGRSGEEVVTIRVDGNATTYKLTTEFELVLTLWPEIGSFTLTFHNDNKNNDVFFETWKPEAMHIEPEHNIQWGCGTSHENERCGTARAGKLYWWGTYTITPAVSFRKGGYGFDAYHGDDAIDLRFKFDAQMASWIQYPSLSACAAAVRSEPDCGSNFSHNIVTSGETVLPVSSFKCICCKKGRSCKEIPAPKRHPFESIYYLDFNNKRPS
eukprot:TRINITY_DN19684_c0_g2_i1.p1 TRINITY_DN19684_c0_g2~~TRINITY_DN19684_c0_g2_i1.p1  ORF type:complete len:358 (-),score=36.07 TRINITY_DN19684_c0_g2_i1:213-1286(-)